MAGRQPFLNLSDLDGADSESVVRELTQLRKTTHQRLFGRRYMELRRLTEQKLRTLFVQSGGRPERTAPHYFVLGSSAWFRGLYFDPREIVIPLSALPPEVTSVTYPDSFVSMALGSPFGVPHSPRPYHERVFRLDQLPELVETYGLPRDRDADGYRGFENWPPETFIEIQLWSDAPISQYLS